MLTEEAPSPQLLESCAVLGVTPLKVDWLLDAISHYEPRPFAAYTL